MQKTVNLSFTSGVLDVLTDAIVWMIPVFTHDGAIDDFEVGYSNKAADEGIKHPMGSLTGLRILRDGVPSRESAEANFGHYLDVYQTGEVREYTFFAHHSNRQYETIRRPFEGGVLSTTRDRKAQREAERKELATRRTLQSIVDGSPNGIALFDAVRDENGEIADFIIRHCNQRRNELLGLSPEEAEKYTFRQILQVLGAESAFDRYVEVVEKGTPIEREQFVAKSQKWLSISTVKLDDSFLAMLTDITELKLAQESLQQHSDYLNSILDASLSAVMTCEAVRDETGKITDLRYSQINEMYKQLIGKSEEEVIGRTMLELFPTAKPTGAFDIHCRVIETGVPARFDVRYQGDGLDAWYNISSVRVGENRVVITFADITEQKAAALEIERQKSLLDNVMKHSPSGIAVYESIRGEEGKVQDFQCIVANEAVESFTCVPNEQRFSKSVLEITPELRDTPLFFQAVHAIETGEQFQTQYKHPTSGKWLAFSVVRMDENHLINVFTDITTTKEAQLQLEHLVEELRRSNNRLEEFAYAASHDLQEPLRKIHTFSDKLKQDLSAQLNSIQQMMFERIVSSTERMRHLIEDLLAFSQVSTRPDTFEQVELTEVAEAVLQDLEASISEAGAVVHVEPLPVINGDERQLRQLFQNLIGNALKYRKPDVTSQVRIVCKVIHGTDTAIAAFTDLPDKKHYLIEVADNGIGFEQQYAERIFQVFQRLHGRAEYEGTGIGLAIVQRVVQNHGGYITAEGKPGVGATFRVLLPV